MKIGEMIELGFANLWRTKLRTFLTVLGVIIGIGALSSMVSFGTGIEKNIKDVFEKNDLLTSIFITPIEIDLEKVSSGDLSGLADSPDQPAIPLNDSTLQIIRSIEGVDMAFPEEIFSARVEFMNDEKNISAAAIPLDMNQYPPFDNITYGDYFDHDSSQAVIIRWELLKRMHVVVAEPDEEIELSEKEKEIGIKVISPDSIIGKPLTLVTAVLDPARLLINTIMRRGNSRGLPVGEHSTVLTIGGVLKRQMAFSRRNVKGDIFIPVKTAHEIPRLGFSSIWDFLDDDRKNDDYTSLFVKASGVEYMGPVVKELKDMGFKVFALSDQLKEVRRGFLILDSILGAIGTIALVVAALGIVNTMVMSILERTREIGIMKAIGGSERQIKLIFFVEAGTIGFIGAIGGLILGWIVTEIANYVANSQFRPLGEEPIDFFYFPVWLILGSIVFSISISLLAGMYPASRAANIDPVKALRHD
ncbi:ABC transporter permease [Bacteroidota bacterium]